VYKAIPNITAERDEQYMPVEEMVRIAAYTNPNKHRQVRKQYDFAHAKAGVTEAQEACRRVESLTSGLSALTEVRGRLVANTSGSRLKTESDAELDSKAEHDIRSSEEQQWNAIRIISLRVLIQYVGTRITVSGKL
jgi:hypothetical protein